MSQKWFKAYVNNSDSRLKGSVFFTLLVLAFRADGGGSGRRSERYIAKDARLSVDQVQVNMQKLEDLGYLKVIGKAKSGAVSYKLQRPGVPKDADQQAAPTD